MQTVKNSVSGTGGSNVGRSNSDSNYTLDINPRGKSHSTVRPKFLKAMRGRLNNRWRNEHVICVSAWELEKPDDTHKRECLGVCWPTSPFRIGGDGGISAYWIEQIEAVWNTLPDETTPAAELTEEQRTECETLREWRDLRHDYMCQDMDKCFLDWVNPKFWEQTLDFAVKWYSARRPDVAAKAVRAHVNTMRRLITTSYKEANSRNILGPVPGAESIFTEFVNIGAVFTGRVVADGGGITVFNRLTPQRKFRKDFTDADFERYLEAGLDPKIVSSVRDGDPLAFIKPWMQVRFREIDLEDTLLADPTLLGPWFDTQIITDYFLTQRAQRCHDIGEHQSRRTLKLGQNSEEVTVTNDLVTV